MNKLKTNLNISFFAILFLIIIGTGSVDYGYAQSGYSPETIQDDPIAAALDSLSSLNLFEKGYARISYPKSSKYHFTPDSVPHYDDMIYEARLAKLDAESPFDLQYNNVVKGYIEMYTMRKRELVSRMMALSQYYFPMFEAQLDKYNLPLELKYLAICFYSDSQLRIVLAIYVSYRKRIWIESYFLR